MKQLRGVLAALRVSIWPHRDVETVERSEHIVCGAASSARDGADRGDMEHPERVGGLLTFGDDHQASGLEIGELLRTIQR